MTAKKELMGIPDALRHILEEGRPRYDSLIRRVHWGEKPVFILGNGPSYAAALSGAWAFQSLLGIPAVVQRPEAFSAYASRALAVHSLLLVAGGAGDCEATVAAAKKARSHGAIVWAITANPSGELAGLADATLSDYAEDSNPYGVRSVFCQHAVMLFLAVAAAQVLKAPAATLKARQEELEKLPTHIEWVLNQIPDAAGALAKEIMALPQLSIIGGGPFYPVAIHSADRTRQTAAVSAQGSDLLDFSQSSPQISPPGSGFLYLSSSRCRLKEQVYQSVHEVRKEGSRRVFAITDRNDRKLSERADLTVLLPTLTEAGGALVALAFLELLAGFYAQSPSPASARKRRAQRP